MAKRLHKEQNVELIGAGEGQNQQRGRTIIWYSSKYTFHMEKEY